MTFEGLVGGFQQAAIRSLRELSRSNLMLDKTFEADRQRALRGDYGLDAQLEAEDRTSMPAWLWEWQMKFTEEHNDDG